MGWQLQPWLYAFTQLMLPAAYVFSRCRPHQTLQQQQLAQQQQSRVSTTSKALSCWSTCDAIHKHYQGACAMALLAGRRAVCSPFLGACCLQVA